MELKNRADMDPRFTWDLTPIYESDVAWEDALKAAIETVKGLASIPGTLGQSPDALKAGLDAVCAAMEQLDRLYGYAYLLHQLRAWIVKQFETYVVQFPRNRKTLPVGEFFLYLCIAQTYRLHRQAF